MSPLRATMQNQEVTFFGSVRARLQSHFDAINVNLQIGMDQPPRPSLYH